MCTCECVFLVLLGLYRYRQTTPYIIEISIIMSQKTKTNNTQKQCNVIMMVLVNMPRPPEVHVMVLVNMPRPPEAHAAPGQTPSAPAAPFAPAGETLTTTGHEQPPSSLPLSPAPPEGGRNGNGGCARRRSLTMPYTVRDWNACVSPDGGVAPTCRIVS